LPHSADPTPPSCFRKSGSGIELFVRLTPKSASDSIEGLAEGLDGKVYLKARVRAVPEGGKANAALEKLLAKAFGVPRRDVAVVSGTTSRLKTVAIAGNASSLIATLTVMLEA